MIFTFLSGMLRRVPLYLFIAAMVASLAASAQRQQKVPKAVFIILDGIPADVIEKLHPPTLDAISSQGGYTRAIVGGNRGTYTETPTISAVGYNSAITGTWVNKHNVWDNDIRDPNYRYKNLFRILEESEPAKKTAIFSTWLDNRTKLIGEGLPEAGGIRLDYSFDGLENDTLAYPHDSNADYIRRIDEAVASRAATVIGNDGPDLSWVYLEYTDDMGHRYGDSEQFFTSIMNADRLVGKIWEAVNSREQKFNEDWLVVITTDHGRDAATGRNHGSQSDRERLGWIVTNAPALNARFRQNPAIVDIMPSVCNHLGITLPANVARELDGVPFIGKVNLSDLRATVRDGKVVLTWKSLSSDPRARVEIFVTSTNKFKEGGEDQYTKVGQAAVGDETFTFTADGFCKVVVKGPDHYVNVWVGR